MHKQSDNGKVTRMAMIEIPVRKKAAGPGPSGSAENALRYLPRCKYSSIMVAIAMHCISSEISRIRWKHFWHFFSFGPKTVSGYD